MEDIFELLKFQKLIIWGAWNSWYFFCVDAGPEPTYEEKWETPPSPWGLSISSNMSLLNAYKWAFVLVAFCPSGLLS